MEYRPVNTVNPDRDVLRCLPESLDQKQQLLDYQEAFGIGAYDGGAFVGSLWFYRIQEKGLGSPLAPSWSGWCRGSEDPRLSLQTLDVEVPLLGLSCFHVGRTKELEAEDRNDESYYGRGIGSGLLAAALKWASEHDYRSVVTTSGIDQFPEFNNWAGMLPLKVYLRNGFHILRKLDTSESIPGHLQDSTPNPREHQLVQAIVGKRANNLA